MFSYIMMPPVLNNASHLLVCILTIHAHYGGMPFLLSKKKGGMNLLNLLLHHSYRLIDATASWITSKQLWKILEIT